MYELTIFIDIPEPTFTTQILPILTNYKRSPLSGRLEPLIFIYLSLKISRNLLSRVNYSTFLSTFNTLFGSSALNPGAVFLRFFTVAFLLFLTPAGGSKPAGPTF